MTTRNKTHFQNVPTGQKSTGRLLHRHFSTVKLKKNFENKVWKTTDSLNRKMEKNRQRASYLIYPHKHCTKLCKKRGLYTTLSYTIGYALILWIYHYTGCGILFNWRKLETELPHLHVPGSKGCQWVWREVKLHFLLLQWTTPWKSFLPASLCCGGEGGYPNWTARIFAILWNQPQRCVYGVHFIFWIWIWNNFISL